ncbi:MULTISPECIES: DUF3263 domain-containing protein [unclassified Modestobacter]|uniref:DUF3263 domain-containing protein n=1 Tax=unclassified Modestobacter TaxID=2643866 RepID=UPI0022AA6315|nr:MULTISPECIES: DUF3263 domain-containing protein [unclassified Modestobacter]MCZ2825307.1 DUF3263 domain-containing protein [Modestobacter sp. VKM Ac-2981]MCZ2853628.1 DUF3263 domain-containing protein [Modestobacter sp. VKM Ac-2982]
MSEDPAQPVGPAAEERPAAVGTDPGTAQGTAADGAAVTGGTHEDDTTVGLPAREREILAFERQWWRFPGAKEAAIRERFGMTSTRYYQVLNALIDRPEALVADPLLVRRLRRMRAGRQRQRSGRVLGTDLRHD